MVVADIIARYKKLQRKKTLLLTGTDEHGIKVIDSGGIPLIVRYKEQPRRLGKIPSNSVLTHLRSSG
jgi:tRNA synthetases class I (M)